MEHCDRCHEPLTEGEHGLYLCPLLARRRQTAAVWQDSIEGGIEIAHGLCNADGSPRRYYSRTEMREAMRAKGIIPYHDVYAEGGNRLLEDARHRDTYVKSGEFARARKDRQEQREEKFRARDRVAR